MTADRDVDALVRAEVSTVFLETTRAPDLATLARRTGFGPDEVEASLRRLEQRVSLKLRPGSADVWTAVPFSATPTLFHVRAGDRQYWASCAWCSLGVAMLADAPATIRSTAGGEDAPIVVEVRADGAPEPSSTQVHFALPASRWVDSRELACSTILFFRDAADVDAWSARHALPRGEVVPVGVVWELARAWFGGNTQPAAHRRSRREAQEILSRAGLTGPFWQL